MANPQHRMRDKSLKKEMADRDSPAVDLSWECMVIGGINVQSLLQPPSKCKTLRMAYLMGLYHIDILVVGESMLKERDTETKEKNQSKKLHIDGFTYVRQDRTYTDSAHGGLIVYIREGIEYKTKSDWEWPGSNVQFLEISIIEPTRLDLVAIYSPHRDHADYVIKLMRFFLKRNKVLNTPVMFVGDLNLDPIARDKKARQEFEQFRKDFSARQLITDYTSKAGYCIDHIITNIPDKGMIPVIPNVINTIDDIQIADHNLVLCRVKNQVQSIHVSELQSLLPKYSLSDLVEVMIEEGKTKSILTIFYELVKSKRVHQTTSQWPVWCHKNLSDDGKVVSFCVEFDNKESVTQRWNAVVAYLQKRIKGKSWNRRWCTLVAWHKRHVSLANGDTHCVGDEDCFLLKCTREQLIFGDRSLHDMLYEFPFAVTEYI